MYVLCKCVPMYTFFGFFFLLLGIIAFVFVVKMNNRLTVQHGWSHSKCSANERVSLNNWRKWNHYPRGMCTRMKVTCFGEEKKNSSESIKKRRDERKLRLRVRDVSFVKLYSILSFPSFLSPAPWWKDKTSFFFYPSKFEG